MGGGRSRHDQGADCSLCRKPHAAARPSLSARLGRKGAMSAVENPNLDIRCENKVASIKNRPRASMTAEQLEAAPQSPSGMLALANALDELRADDSIRVII